MTLARGDVDVLIELPEAVQACRDKMERQTIVGQRRASIEIPGVDERAGVDRLPVTQPVTGWALGLVTCQHTVGWAQERTKCAHGRQQPKPSRPVRSNSHTFLQMSAAVLLKRPRIRALSSCYHPEASARSLEAAVTDL